MIVSFIVATPAEENKETSGSGGVARPKARGSWGERSGVTSHLSVNRAAIARVSDVERRQQKGEGRNSPTVFFSFLFLLFKSFCQLLLPIVPSSALCSTSSPSPKRRSGSKRPPKHRPTNPSGKHTSSRSHHHTLPFHFCDRAPSPTG